MRTKKFMIALMAALMVFAFGAANAFAAESPWAWNEDYSACTFTDTDGEIYDATVTAKETPATCLTDAYVTHTAKWHGLTDEVVVDEPDTALGHAWILDETTLVQGQGLTGYWICDREGCDAHYEANTMTLIDIDEEDGTCWNNGTITKAGNVIDPDGDKAIIFGTREVSGTSHAAQDKILREDEVAATCETDGHVEYWYCTECEKYWVEDEEGDMVEVNEAATVIEKTGHNYDISYEFAKDGKKCSAVATCDNEGCEHPFIRVAVTPTESSDGVITSEAVKAPTSTEMGVTQYNATFTNELFTTQTKEVADIPCVYEGDWSKDHTKCVAKCKDKPEYDAANIAVTYEGGQAVYTATFTQEGIGPFVDKVDNPSIMTATAKNIKAKASKKVTKKNITVKNAAGDVTYKKVKGNAKIKVNAKTGKITVNKGLKKGKTYTVKVKVSDSGSEQYMPGEQFVTFKVKVTK